MRIGSYRHFWKFDPVMDFWINDGMKVLQQYFLPADFYSLLKEK